MTRRYAAMFDFDREHWKVIYQDDPDPIWYVEVPDAATQYAATKIADALNAAES